ncbi:MAG: hypothetical protein HQ556_05780 [Candidatus Marinimicrobia bacterium]|nr:hypothetical protein [Candidatus Neomarinimicrobiota bacterium]
MTKQTVLVFISFCLLIFSCGEVDDDPKDIVASSSCVGCHNNIDLLLVVADPIEDTGGESTGEG